ncbi:MAG: response regulator [Chlamydiota bacterium]|nr:response regulator [Chlamydiota bacterium]
MIEAKTKKILIVEDDEDIQEMYRMFFESVHDRYHIDIEGEGGVALNRLKAKTYDLIILDIVMEPMSGDSFLYYARQDKRTQNTPVLVVSVLESEILENLKKLPNVDFLQKPVTQEQLFSRIDSLLHTDKTG